MMKVRAGVVDGEQSPRAELGRLGATATHTVSPMSREREWVEALALPAQRIQATRALIGAVNARELRAVVVSEASLQALIEGLRHPNAQVRWWCVQLLDHCSDGRAIDAIVP